MSSGQAQGHSTYREKLRQVEALHPPRRDVAPKKPNWTEQVDDGWRPLFDVLTCFDEPKEDPEVELARIRQAAYREGYDEGLKRGKDTIDAIVDRYQAAMMQLETVRDEVLVQTEADLVNLAILIAQQVLCAEHDLARDFTERMTEHVLKTLRDADQITLKVGKTDLEQVRRRHPEFIGNDTVVRLVEDPSIEVGGLVAECALGRVDARIEHRLVEIAKQLTSGDIPTGDGNAV